MMHGYKNFLDHPAEIRGRIKNSDLVGVTEEILAIAKSFFHVDLNKENGWTAQYKYGHDNRSYAIEFQHREQGIKHNLSGPAVLHVMFETTNRFSVDYYIDGLPYDDIEFSCHPKVLKHKINSIIEL